MPSTPQSFADFDLPTAVVNALAKDGKTTPFPIQTATLPDTLAGRDVLGRGRTGSGKTLAFSLPMVTRLDAARPEGRRRAARPRGLVLAPTRELASQIDATLAPLAKSLGLTTTVIFGGVAQSRQVNALAAGVDIVVACPGRLEDLLGQGHLTLDDIEITVLDEADHMADLGFLPGVKRIMDRTPKRGQRMLFSATLDNGVDVLVKRYLSDPLHHSVDSAQSPVAAMTHHIFEVADAGVKRDVVTQLASGTNRRILFTRTKHQAKKLAKTLTADGIPAVDLHGNLSQGARERNLEAFSTGAVKVLCATDIAARGIHVDEVELVVHVDPPAEHKAYLHRSGRTARAGHGGDVVTVMLPEQRGDVKDLTRKAKIAATPERVRAGDARIAELVGDVAELVAPSAAPAAAQPAPKQPRKKKPAGETARGAGRGAQQGGGQRGGAQRGQRSEQAGQGGGRRSGQSAEGGRGRRGAGSAPTTYSTSTPSSGGSGRSGQGRSGGSRQGATSGRTRTAADFSRGRGR
ncbi:DEAD/DEAH box helicase [Sanguibacter hominis ATCC BAA-789]|uniref:DEAD/DEAH box helicase n=1 Tax=Sanguibacter hominis ATCC BAA-789 TaxID=1312740 RepID=A0A9X5ISG4_9MICO|nr:DEAD/DEAH box helicase [Sanguibacter hominis]NKX93978.1 DEAD/DEAH box helicase [Sanguibacter hominis ATCC BAA-789]